MFRPLLQTSLKAFIHRGVTRKQECEFTNTCFAFIDDPTVSVETLRMHSFQKEHCVCKYELCNNCFTTLVA